MKPKLIALNAILLIGIVAIVWQARVRWQEAQARRAANLNVAIKPVPLPPLVPAPKPQAVPAAKYVDVANNDLFTKDRNPVVAVDPPKVEKPKEMPHLPIVYGVLGLPSGTRAIMAEKANGPSSPVREGDTVGEFRIVALDTANVTFEWNGQQISRKIDDLIDRSTPSGNAGASQMAAAPQPQIPQPNTVQVNQVNNAKPSAANLGAEIGRPGASQRACMPSDSSPAGAVVEGYKKTITPTPFGPICKWVQTQ